MLNTTHKIDQIQTEHCFDLCVILYLA